MENCLKCAKELKGAVKSAVKEDKSFYLACAGCGNVHYVTVDENGITSVRNTLEGGDQEVKDQMIEAKQLFELASKGITQYIATMNGEKKSASDLVVIEEEPINYEDVKDTAKESIKDIVKSIADSIGVKDIEIKDKDADKIASLIVKVIKEEDLSCGCNCKK